MHVMFIHPNFPAQFGHIAHHLATSRKWPCTFVTSIDTRRLELPFNHINYRTKPGELPKHFYNPQKVGTMMAHMQAIYKGLKSAPQIRPDLVVGHMSYGTMLFLRNLYDCPFVGYFEILPPPFWTDQIVRRADYPPPEQIRLFNATYHTFTYLHLHAVEAAYTPTNYQLTTAPKELQYKISVLFDGVDTKLYQPRTICRPVTFRGIRIEPGTKVITYASRGLESVRGFDIFMRVAKRLCERFPEAIFLVAGNERTHYGHEMHHITAKSFKQHILSRDNYDVRRFHFLGQIPASDLAMLFNLSDLHIYLTVPWVLSWSLVQAMSSGCTIVASNTEPLAEAIEHEKHGLLGGFFDVDELTELASQVLKCPEEHRCFGRAARERALERYEQRHCIDSLVAYFEQVAAKRACSGPDDVEPVTP